MDAKYRYLKHDLIAKIVWTIHLISQGNLDIVGFDKEVYKGFEIKSGNKEYELMRADSLTGEQWPKEWPYQIHARKMPEKYKSDPNCSQFYVMLWNDWSKAQLIAADEKWTLTPSKVYAQADQAKSWTVPINPFAAAIGRALDKYREDCIAYGKAEAMRVA
jgi:hypothetical protein